MERSESSADLCRTKLQQSRVSSGRPQGDEYHGRSFSCFCSTEAGCYSRPQLQDLAKFHVTGSRAIVADVVRSLGVCHWPFGSSEDLTIPTKGSVRGVSWSLLATVPKRKSRRSLDMNFLWNSEEDVWKVWKKSNGKERKRRRVKRTTTTQRTDDHAWMERRGLDDLSHDVTQCELMICTQVLRSECCARSCARQCQC